jgi:hypothetical protein
MFQIGLCIERGTYLDTRHAFDRQNERQISRPEVLYVLKNGHHEKRKDKFDEAYHSWNYSVRGKTVDRRELRVIVSFDELGMLIITAIDLGSLYGD